jgi:hypothetical protein
MCDCDNEEGTLRFDHKDHSEWKLLKTDRPIGAMDNIAAIWIPRKASGGDIESAFEAFSRDR